MGQINGTIRETLDGLHLEGVLCLSLYLAGLVVKGEALVFAVSKLAMSQKAGYLQIYATAYHNGWPEELRSSFGKGTPHRCE
jgi:hypothetical protein